MEIITGRTKIEKLDHNDQILYFKREDQNPSGSFKDRLIDHVWQDLIGMDSEEIVLSSSGNLAISLLYFQINSDRKLNKKIKIFVKDNMMETKFSRLRSLADKAGAELVVSKKPKSDCFRYASQDGVYWLRNSEGEDYPKAYHSLANEIIEHEVKEGVQFDAVLIATSSATAAVGMMEQFQSKEKQMPVYLVQTSHINSIAKEFDQDFQSEEDTLANAISDRVAKRKSEAVELAKALQGGGVVCDNKQILEAQNILQDLLEDEFSGNAALPLAGFFKLREKGYNLVNPLLIISGN